jgi:LuxR family maltose regulon positive regulatory protein
MQTPLLTTKLNIPPLRHDRVTRPRLVAHLNKGLMAGTRFLRKLSFVSAPAGYGKTTMVLEWLDQISILDPESKLGDSIAWVSVDESDNDPARFISYIIAAIQRVQPGYGEATAALVHSPQPPPWEAILTTLINEMAAIVQPFLLLLDDYHTIRTPEIHRQVGFLLEHQPHHMHLVLITREDPLLPLSRLRAGGQMVEIRQDELRFSPSECAEFLQVVMGIPLSGAEIAALERRTEGWIAGLQLAAFSLRGHDNPAGFVKAFTGSNRFVLDYLVEEVYKRQPVELQDFLLKTSILDRLSGPLCNAITGIDNSQEILENLEQVNLFIISLDQSRTWYRYHRLFAELLHHRLRGTVKLDEVDLNNRASQWFEANNFIGEAIDYAIAASNWDRAGSLVSNFTTEMLKRGEIATLIRWFDKFPQEVLLGNPRLCFNYCWPLLLSGQFEKAAPLLDHVERIAKDVPLFFGEVMAAQAYLARALGDHAKMVACSERALELLPKTSVESRGLVAINLGLAYWHMGMMEAAEEALTEAMETGKASDNHYSMLTALIFQGRVHAVRGQLHKAASYFQNALERGGRIPINALAHMDLGTLHYEWNNLEKSAQHLEAAIEFSRLGKNDEFVVSSWIRLARTRLAQGDQKSAVDILSKAQDRVQVGDIPIGTAARVAAMAVLVALARNDLGTALAHADQLNEQLDAHSFYRFLGLAKARLLIAQNDLEAASNYLKNLKETASKSGWGYGLIATQVWQALAAGDPAATMDYLVDALEKAEPEGYIQTFVEGGQKLIPHLREAARRGIEPDYVRRILDALGDTRTQSRDQTALVEPLSPRELEVLHLLIAGLSNRQIAEKLVISTGTAKTHVHNICGKLGARNRTEAAVRARELGLV